RRALRRRRGARLPLCRGRPAPNRPVPRGREAGTRPRGRPENRSAAPAAGPDVKAVHPAASLRGLTFEDARRVRDIRNQALFRELNERILKLQRPCTFIEFACECSDQHCAESIVLSVLEYEAVRRSPAYFVVVPAHVRADDVPVASSDRYAIV